MSPNKEKLVFWGQIVMNVSFLLIALVGVTAFQSRDITTSSIVIATMCGIFLITSTGEALKGIKRVALLVTVLLIILVVYFRAGYLIASHVVRLRPLEWWMLFAMVIGAALVLYVSFRAREVEPQESEPKSIG